MFRQTTRRLALAAAVLAQAACANQQAMAVSRPTVAEDMGASSRVPKRPLPLPVHDGRADAHAMAVVNAVDPAKRTMNVSHEPIPAIGWPAMTMDFAVAPSVDLTAVKPGSRVNIAIEKGKNGIYEVHGVQPAGKAR